MLVYIKHILNSNIDILEFYEDDGIWLIFDFLPNILISGWYIPPEDSSYYKTEVFASLFSLLINETRGCVVLGDFNAKIKNLNEILPIHEKGKYEIESSKYNNHGELL